MFFAVSGTRLTPLAVNAIAPHAGRGLRRRFMERRRFANGARTRQTPTLTGCGKPSGCCPNIAEVKKGAGHERGRLVPGWAAGH
ncbi:MAG: hypothetical protein ACOX7Q_17590 [Kiritimatiellia bacterium]|jgi:hypothetical protein